MTLAITLVSIAAYIFIGLTYLRVVIVSIGEEPEDGFMWTMAFLATAVFWPLSLPVGLIVYMVGAYSNRRKRKGIQEPLLAREFKNPIMRKITSNVKKIMD